MKLRGASTSPLVLVSFQWLGKEEAEPIAPEPAELEVVDGVFKGSFTLPRGRWQVSVVGQVDGGAYGTATSKSKVQYDAFIATVSAVGGKTRVLVTADGELVSEVGQ